jgi:TetR/AcrR family transcriptional regulator, transcriptional repressor for nem operon
VLNWRKRFRERLELIAARYLPKASVDLDDLADMLSVIADGGIILSRVVNDKQALSRQIMLYRDFKGRSSWGPYDAQMTTRTNSMGAV